MNKTPFDQLALELLKSNIELRDSEVGSITIDLAHFVEVCRVCYLQMINASQPLWQNIELIQKHSETHEEKITLDEMSQNNFQVVNPNVCYFQFIEYLNRYGRVLKKQGFTIPHYEEIRFYRNKAIEHWDEYEPLMHNTQGQYFILNKIAVPFHMGTSNIPLKSEVTIKKLKELLEPSDKIPTLEELLNPEARSHFLFIMLIDKYGENLSAMRNKQPIVPNKVVKLLFELGFPLPIHDVEEYINILIKEIHNYLVKAENKF